MADDIIPLRHSYALSMVERISELEAEVERLRAAGDALCRYVVESGPGLHDDEAVIAYWNEARRG